MGKMACTALKLYCHTIAARFLNGRRATAMEDPDDVSRQDDTPTINIKQLLRQAHEEYDAVNDLMDR